MKKEINNYNYTMSITKTELQAEIRRLAREKNAVIMAHYYVSGELSTVK